MKKITFDVSEERRAECATARESYKPLDVPVWTEGKTDFWDGDFGDYRGGVFSIEAFELVNGTIVPRVIHWSVDKKIMNEWFGAGGLHVGYGDANSVELAKAFVAQAVENHRKVATLRIPEPHDY